MSTSPVSDGDALPASGPPASMPSSDAAHGDVLPASGPPASLPPAGAAPGDSRPADVLTADARPGNVLPGDLRSGDERPGTPQPAETLPGDLVVDWYAWAARDLPWRTEGVDAWAVLVSEVMLQQTPVARVEPVWREWLRRWPTPADLAAAPTGDVIRAWGKLGYPRRAMRLQAAAAAIAAEHGNVVPADVAVLQSLPGIGTYTARAVACFGYGQRQPVVDTNVRRVVARLVHGRAEAAPARAGDLNDVAALAPADPERGVRFSVAVMELGALVCVAGVPRCGGCPIRALCAWRLAGSPPHDGPPKKVQKFAGTDRQVRGRLLDVLRAAHDPVEAAALDVVWDDAVQRSRCLDSLLVDGLVVQTEDDRFALPS